MHSGLVYSLLPSLILRSRRGHFEARLGKDDTPTRVPLEAGDAIAFRSKVPSICVTSD